MRTILATATSDGNITTNPAHIRGAGSSKRVQEIRPATLPELEKLTAAMPERYQAMILLASWCALRFGELTELRPKDVQLDPADDDVRGGVSVFGARWSESTVSSSSVIRSPKPAAAT